MSAVPGFFCVLVPLLPSSPSPARVPLPSLVVSLPTSHSLLLLPKDVTLARLVVTSLGLFVRVAVQKGQEPMKNDPILDQLLQLADKDEENERAYQQGNITQQDYESQRNNLANLNAYVLGQVTEGYGEP